MIMNIVHMSRPNYIVIKQCFFGKSLKKMKLMILKNGLISITRQKRMLEH